MAAHRYWRALGFEAHGAGDLELSEFHLLAGTSRVDASATLVANMAPTTGTLAALQDDVLSTSARWTAAAVPSLSLQWDFGGAPEDVSDIRLGAADAVARFPLLMQLQYSDDAVTWVVAGNIRGILWPGARTKTASVGDRVFVRGAGTHVILTSATTISVPPPAEAQVGDLLVVALMRRSTAAALPTGWTLRSAAGPGATAGVSQWSDVYTKVATASDLSGPTSFGQETALRLLGQMLALAGTLSPAIYEAQAVAAGTDVSLASFPLPALEAAGAGRLMVGLISLVSVATPSSMTTTARLSLHSPSSLTDNRLAVVSRAMGLGGSTLGDEVGNAGGLTGWTGNAVMFAGNLLIARSLVNGRSDVAAFSKCSTEDRKSVV